MGTDAWRNWRAYDAKVPELEYLEAEAHSDRQITGGPVQIGPTTVHVVIRESEEIGPALILHTGVHADLMPELVTEGGLALADSSRYHGGTMSDEVAALIALELGVRLRVAGTRTLSGRHDGDPGAPIHLEVQRLNRPGRPGRELLPRVTQRPASLESLTRSTRFVQLDDSTAVSLVRAAREYESAIWWSNEDPDQGWLHLVAASEIAAAERQAESAEPTDLVREHWPELWRALEGADADTRERVSKEVAPQMRATRKFIDFIAELAPEPPERRPPTDLLDWGAMRDHTKIIYGHRSKALHAGKPFPLPMREAPRIDADGALQEAPWGLTTGGLGAIWERKETPMLLSTFERIVRGALLKWWGELLDRTAGAGVPA